MVHVLHGRARPAGQVATQLRNVKRIVEVVLRSSKRRLLRGSVEEGRLRRGRGTSTRLRTEGRALLLRVWIRSEGILLSCAILTEALANVLKWIGGAAACSTGDKIGHGHGGLNQTEPRSAVERR